MDAFIKKILSSCLILLLFFETLNAVELNKKISKNSINLILNGQGVRDKFFINLYIGGLYLLKKSDNAKQIVAANKPMNIRLHIVSSLITSQKMKDGTIEGFEKATKENMAPLQTRVDSFIAVFGEEIRENDIYDFFYLPSNGTKIYKNNKLIETIKGLDFKKALYGIWLGDNPAQKSLKENMLGK